MNIFVLPMGSGLSKTIFDLPEDGPSCGMMKTVFISNSYFFCLVQHNAEWPDFYLILDVRSKKEYTKHHVVGALHADSVEDLDNVINGVTVVIYGAHGTHPNVTKMLKTLEASQSSPSSIYIVKERFRTFRKVYCVALHSFTKTEDELPGPVELIPKTKKTPAVYMIHRNQFHHCKTTIAYLGCTTLINISSRRLFLKTSAIKLENIQFDTMNEPYDEAIEAFERHMGHRSRQRHRGNILIIDETGCDYSFLIVGWYIHDKGFDTEKICEHLPNKIGELDPWYLNVLRAWSSD